MNLSALEQTMVLLFATIAAGYAAAKLGLVDEGFSRGLSRLTLHILQVCMILSSVLNTEHLLSSVEVLKLTGISVLCYVGLLLLALLLRPLLRVRGKDAGQYQFLFIFSNVGFIGYPIVEAVFGADARFYVTIFILMFQLMVFTYGVFLLSGDRRHVRFSRELLKKPVIWASVLAYIIYFTGLRVPQLFAEAVRYVGNITTPASMLIIGSTLAAVPLRAVFTNWRMYAMLALKMVCVPLLAFAALRPLMSSDLLLGIVIVMLAMPCATNATMLSVEYGGDAKRASAGVFLSTLLSILTIPAIMWLLFGRG